MGASVHRSERLKGARVGQHEIVRLIGHGATASVFEARHVALGKPVAIKLLHEHLASDEHLAGRFVREGRVAAKLNHPNAIGVIDVGVEDGVPYLVMEMLRGTDLRALLADAAPLSVEHTLGFLLPIASALQHAHDAGVLHRDIKPANIFLARDVRDDVVPKLLDFGLSKSASAGAEMALTQTELVAGTVLYMAPEQTLGVRNSSPASDQYSLAAVVYECVTGVPPFAPEGTVYDVMERVRTTAPQPPSAVRPTLPPALDAVLLRAMAHDPKARHESVATFARDLLPFADEATRRALGRDFSRPFAESDGSLAAGPSVERASGQRPVSSSTETLAEILPASAPAPAPAPSAPVSAPTPARPRPKTIGPLPCEAGAGPFRIKGIFYKGFVHKLGTAVGLDAFCDALPDPTLRTFLRQPFLASGLYDIFPFAAACQALANRLGVGLQELGCTSAAAQARYDAKHVYKTIFTSNEPEQVAERIGRFNAQIYDFGKFSGTVLGPKHMATDFAAIPAYLEPWFGPMHVAYTIETLSIVGAQEPTVVSQQVRDAGKRRGYPLVSFRTELRWR